MKLKTGTSGSTVVAGTPWYEQAGALGLGTVGLGALSLLAGLGVLGLAMLGPIWPVFDIAAHLGLHAAGAVFGGILAIFLVWCGWPIRAVLALPAIAVATIALPSVIAIFSTLGVDDATTRPAQGTLRIVSLNTWHSNQDLDATVTFLEQVKADVVVLAEFGPEKRRVLRRLATSYPYQTGCSQVIYCGMQLLSRYPLKNTSFLSRHLRTGPPTVLATLGPELGGLQIIGVHLMRPIDSYLGNYREVQQIAGLAREANILGPVVVAGDFNLTGWSSNWRTFRNRSGLMHMDRFLPSWPAAPSGLPQLAIDHVFASQGITFERVRLGPAVGSDHRPLVVDIRLPDRKR